MKRILPAALFALTLVVSLPFGITRAILRTVAHAEAMDISVVAVLASFARAVLTTEGVISVVVVSTSGMRALRTVLTSFVAIPLMHSVFAAGTVHTAVPHQGVVLAMTCLVLFLLTLIRLVVLRWVRLNEAVALGDLLHNELVYLRTTLTTSVLEDLQDATINIHIRSVFGDLSLHPSYSRRRRLECKLDFRLILWIIM